MGLDAIRRALKISKDKIAWRVGIIHSGVDMIPFRMQREFPTPSLTAFVSLQVLDIITTLIGLRMGASESSMFIGRLMQVGPLAALLIAKLFAVALVSIALKMQRPRLVVFLNFWFVAVVTWNLIMIVIVGVSS